VHVFALFRDCHCDAVDLASGDDGDKGLLESEGKEVEFPVVGGAEAVAFGEEDDFFLVFEFGGAFVESDLAVDDEVEALRVFLFLVDEGLLLEFGEEHAAADVVDGREVVHALDGLDLSGATLTFSSILTRLFISAMVLFSGSDIRI
jgi:hypothetical protein